QRPVVGRAGLLAAQQDALQLLRRSTHTIVGQLLDNRAGIAPLTDYQPWAAPDHLGRKWEGVLARPAGRQRGGRAPPLLAKRAPPNDRRKVGGRQPADLLYEPA